MPTKKQLRLGPKGIERSLFNRIRPYDKLSFLEQYAMFMGKAQVLEFGLKALLARQFGVDLEEMEIWTLGRTTGELKQRGLRKDFIVLLEGLVKRRNFIAHELLAGDAMAKLLTGRNLRSARRPLQHGIYELEQVLLLHDWFEEHGAWVLKDTTGNSAPLPSARSAAVPSHAQAGSRASPQKSHDHLVQIDEQGREVRIFRLSASGTKTLFTSAPLPAADARADITEFAKQLGENLLLDSPSARKLLNL